MLNRLWDNYIYNPWPEEVNRSIIARIAKYHFAPNEIARNNLNKEGIIENIFIVKNTINDALSIIMNKFNENEQYSINIRNYFSGLGVQFDRQIILFTLHRRETSSENIVKILLGIKELTKINPNLQIIFPVHLNPIIRTLVKNTLESTTNVFLLEPLQYSYFLYIMSQANIVITDSAGTQEEAEILQKPTLIVREFTERKEGLKNGKTKLIGLNSQLLIETICDLLNLNSNKICFLDFYSETLYNSSESIIKHISSFK